MSDALPVRATAWEKPRTFQVAGDALLVTAIVQPGAAAAAPTTIPLRDIVEIRLSHYPARFQFNRFRCRLQTRNGSVHSLSNAFYEGPLSEKDCSAEYRTFVNELCRGVAAANPAARFRRGRTRIAMYLENGALALMFAVLIGVWVTLKPSLHWFQIMNLALIVVYLPIAVVSFRRNRPGQFDPLAVPDEILPK